RAVLRAAGLRSPPDRRLVDLSAQRVARLPCQRARARRLTYVPGMTIDFPQRHLSALSDVATRLLDSRKPKTDLHPLARELYAGFCDVCARYGLDRALAELGDSDAMVAALVGKLDAIDLDGGGPRNAKPRQLVD